LNQVAAVSQYLLRTVEELPGSTHWSLKNPSNIFMLLGFLKLQCVLPGSSSTVLLGGGNSMNSCSATPQMAQEGASDHCPTPPRNTLLLLLSTHEGRTQQRYGGSSCYYAACLNICARYSPACVLPSWSSMLMSYLWKGGHTVVGSMEYC